MLNNSNKTFNCVIIEDEEHNTRLIENYISQVDELHLLASFVSTLDLLNFEDKEKIDIIQREIQTPVMTGVDFLKMHNVKQAEVFITTAYDNYAMKGYEFDVTDYLLKPVELPRFITASQKAISRITLKAQVSVQPNEGSFLLLNVDTKPIRIAPKELIFIFII